MIRKSDDPLAGQRLDPLPAIPGFICPICGSSLIVEEPHLVSTQCGARFKVEDGIPAFTDHDDFYEGRFQCVHLEPESHPHPWRRRFYHRFGWDYYTIRRRFFLKHLNASGRVLDIGCAGGSEFLGRVGPVAGVDLSRQSLIAARDVAGYDRVAQAEIGKLPFPDNSFEYVVTGDVLGHLDAELKETLLDDIERLLVPGGLTFHSIETFGSIRRWARRLDERLYDSHLVEAYGHIGLETPEATLERFRRRGWNIMDIDRSMHFSLNEILESFDNGYVHHSALLGAGIPILRLLNRHPVTRFFGNQVLRVFELSRRMLTPLSSADVIFVAAQVK